MAKISQSTVCIPLAARMAGLSLHPVPEHKSEANGLCLLWASSKAAQAWRSEAFLPLHWLIWRRRAVFWEKQNLAAAGDGEQEAQCWSGEISHGPHICGEEKNILGGGQMVAAMCKEYPFLKKAMYVSYFELVLAVASLQTCLSVRCLGKWTVFCRRRTLSRVS